MKLYGFENFFLTINFKNQLQLWIAGGNGKPDGETIYHNTIEYIDENGGTLAPGLLTTFSNFKYYFGCAMSINNTHAMYIGGAYAPISESIIINIYDGTVTNGPGIEYNLRNHVCERFKHSNGTNFLIIGKK